MVLGAGCWGVSGVAAHASLGVDPISWTPEHEGDPRCQEPTNHIQKKRASRTGRVRLHRGLLQHASTPFRIGLSLASGFRAEKRGCCVIARLASAPDDVKLRSSRSSSASLRPWRVTSSSATAVCRYAESGAFGVDDFATIIKPAPTRVVLDAQLSTRPRNRGRLTVPNTQHPSTAAKPLNGVSMAKFVLRYTAQYPQHPTPQHRGEAAKSIRYRSP